MENSPDISSDTAAMHARLMEIAKDRPADKLALVLDARDRIRSIAAECYESQLGLALVSAELAVGEESNGLRCM